MTFSFSDFAAALKGGASIAPEDVLSARRRAWGDGAIAREEAEAIFEIDRLAADPPHEWTDFFVEALTEYVVNRRPPRGYVEEADAAWLMAQIDRDGRVDTMSELELLVKVVETALNVPQRLKDYALAQIERAVLSGEGPTRRGGPIRPGTIEESEVALLRRLVFAAGGDGALVVSRSEAEMLWRLKDATLGGDNAPAWKTLFVQAVGNHLMAYSGYRPLDRAEAERREAWTRDRGGSVGGFLSRMLSTAPDLEGARATFARGRSAGEHDAAVAAAQQVTGEEGSWLQGRVRQDGETDAFEQALLDFIAEESAGRAAS